MKERPTAISTSLDSSHLQYLEQLDDEKFWDYARELAHQAPTAAQSEEALECTLSRGQCLIPLAALYELVLPPHRLALLPATPEWMIGVVAWHGETIAVIDLDRYLSGHTADLANGMLLVANHVGLPVGLLVDRVGQARPIQQNTIKKKTLAANTDASTDEIAAFVREVGMQAPILDMPSLLADMVRQIGIAASNG
jgi:chemotaxis signal transduction protein